MFKEEEYLADVIGDLGRARVESFQVLFVDLAHALQIIRLVGRKLEEGIYLHAIIDRLVVRVSSTFWLSGGLDKEDGVRRHDLFLKLKNG